MENLQRTSISGKLGYIYTQVRNDAVAAVREAKYRFEKSIAEEVQQGDTASFYAYLRSQTTIKEEVSRVTWPDGSLTTSNLETANAINQSFQRVFVKEGEGPIPQLDFHFIGEPLVDVEFTIQNVYDILIHLKESSAPGPCNFHPKILIVCARGFASPLYYIFIDSLVLRPWHCP